MNHGTLFKSLILLSGGLDSSAQCAYLEKEGKIQSAAALTFHYGQKAALKEIQAAKKISEYYHIPHHVIELPFFKSFGRSALLVETESMPHLEIQELDQLEKIQKTAEKVWVPNRNGIFIHVASGFAEANGFQEVLVGFNLEEATTFPDNTQAFLETLNQSLFYSTQEKVKVKSHTTTLTKSEIVRALKNMPKKFPFEFVWSCYEGFEQACGTCESCRRLKRALESPLA